MSYQAPQIQYAGGNLVRVLHPEAVEPSTYLTAAVSAGGVTLTLPTNDGFSNTDPQSNVLIGALGSEATEIKRVNGAITAGTSLTVQALTYDHSADTRVSRLLFDQVEISGASTATGSKTVIATVSLNVSGIATDYVVAATTYAYYFARFKNSLATTPYFGDYSDAIAATGFSNKTVGFIRSVAFENLNEKAGEKYPDRWVYDTVWLGELDIAKRVKRWSWLRETEYDLGSVATGDRSISLPSNIEDPNTEKSILSIRIGTGFPLTYVGKAELLQLQEGTSRTTLYSTASVSATTLTLTDSDDFEDSGTVNIGGTEYSYTANDRSTNVLSGLTALSAQIDSGANVYQGATFAEPTQFTVDEGVVLFDYPLASTLNGRNVWIDYYKVPTRADSDGDLLTVNDPDCVRLYLERAIKAKKSNGNLPTDDVANVLYEQRVKNLIANEISGQTLRMVPAVPNGRFNSRLRR